MKKIFCFSCLLFAVLFFVSITGSVFAQQDERLKTIDKYIEKAMKDWNIPGMAVGIVKDGEVIFAKGYGVRNINEPGKKVNDETLFGIASNTKAFTASALGTLVDDKKIHWDDRVRKYLPYFQLYDPFVSENMTIRDLLCHRSGLKTFSGDLLWNGTIYNREEVVRRARFLKPAYDFRTHFGYSNIMFIAAGEIIPAVTGTSWDDYIKQTFLTPLGMKSTNTSITDFKESDNVASPHAEGENREMIPIPYVNWDNMGGAGAINSNITDMCRWIKMQLNRGSLNGKNYFSEAISREMWTPHTIQRIGMTENKLRPTTHFKAYGLGWAVFDYKGLKVVNHGGGLDGMISKVALVPEEQLGFVILTNNINYLPSALMYYLIDRFVDAENKDWSGIYLKFKQYSENAEKERIKTMNEQRAENTLPSLALEKYTGIYGGEMYGDAEVKLENGNLVVGFLPTPMYIGDLEHWHYDIFTIELRNVPSLPKGTVQFIIGVDGEVEEMRIDIPNPDFYFTELEFKKKK